MSKTPVVNQLCVSYSNKNNLGYNNYQDKKGLPQMPLQSQTRPVPRPPFQIVQVNSNQSTNSSRSNSSSQGLRRGHWWTRLNEALNRHSTFISIILGAGLSLWGILLTIKYGDNQAQLKALQQVVTEQQDLNRCFSLFIEQQSVMNQKLFALDSLSRDQLKVLNDTRAMTVQESKNSLLAFCRSALSRFDGPTAQFGKLYVAGNMNGATDGECSLYSELANTLEPFLQEMRSQNGLYLQKNQEANKYWQQNINYYTIQRNTGGCPTVKERETMTSGLYDAEENWRRLIRMLRER